MQLHHSTAGNAFGFGHLGAFYYTIEELLATTMSRMRKPSQEFGRTLDPPEICALSKIEENRGKRAGPLPEHLPNTRKADMENQRNSPRKSPKIASSESMEAESHSAREAARLAGVSIDTL